MPYRGGILTIDSPDLLYLRDTNGDGRADERRVEWTGFFPGSQQLRANALHWGLDNWIYGANGRCDGENPAFRQRGRSGHFDPRARLSVSSSRSRLKRAGRIPTDRRAKPIRTVPGRLGKPVPVLEHDSGPRGRRAGALRNGPAAVSIASRGRPCLSRRHGPSLPDQSSAAAVQCRAGRLLQCHVRADRLSRRRTW